MNYTDEKELIDKAKHGDVEAFEELIFDFKGKIISLIFLFEESYQDALTISQDVFVLAFKSIKKYNTKMDFFIWLCGIAINHYTGMLKSSKQKTFNYNTNNINIVDLLNLDISINHFEEEFDEKLLNSLKVFLNKLNSDIKILIILKKIFGFSTQNISEILRLPSKTMKIKIENAKKQLGILLSNLFNFNEDTHKEANCNYFDYLQSYFYGDLTPIGTSKLLEHKKFCPLCSDELNKIELLNSHFKYFQSLKFSASFDNELYNKLVKSINTKNKLNIPLINIAIPSFILLVMVLGVLFNKINPNIPFLLKKITETTSVDQRQNRINSKTNSKSNTSSVPQNLGQPTEQNTNIEQENSPLNQNPEIINEFNIPTPSLPASPTNTNNLALPANNNKSSAKQTGLLNNNLTIKKPQINNIPEPPKETTSTIDKVESSIQYTNNKNQIQQPKPKILPQGKNIEKTKITSSGPLKFTTLARGNICNHTMVGDFTIKSEEELSSFWNSMFGGSKPQPSVNFNQDIVLAVTQGQKNIGGYSIRISSIYEKKDRIEVKIIETAPANEMVTLVNTSPYYIVKIKRTNKRVLFIW